MQLFGQLRDDPVLEPMHPTSRAVGPDHAVESDAVLPHGIDDLAGLHLPRPLGARAFQPETAVGPTDAEDLVARQKLYLRRFADRLTQQAGKLIMVNRLFGGAISRSEAARIEQASEC